MELLKWEVITGTKDEDQLFTASGEVRLTPETIQKLAQKCGNIATDTFQNHIKLEIAFHLAREKKVPNAFDMHAIVVQLLPGTAIQDWAIHVIAIRRF